MSHLSDSMDAPSNPQYIWRSHNFLSHDHRWHHIDNGISPNNPGHNVQQNRLQTKGKQWHKIWSQCKLRVTLLSYFDTYCYWWTKESPYLLTQGSGKLGWNKEEKNVSNPVNMLTSTNTLFVYKNIHIIAFILHRKLHCKNMNEFNPNKKFPLPRQYCSNNNISDRSPNILILHYKNLNKLANYSKTIYQNKPNR